MEQHEPTPAPQPEAASQVAPAHIDASGSIPGELAPAPAAEPAPAPQPSEPEPSPAPAPEPAMYRSRAQAPETPAPVPAFLAHIRKSFWD